MAIVYLLGGLATLALVLIVAFYIVISLLNHYKTTSHSWKLLAMQRDQLRVSQARQVFPNDDGVYPALWDGQRALDLNRGVVMDFNGVRSAMPELLKSANWTRVLTKAGWPTGAVAEHLLPEPEPAHWPAEVPLKTVCAEPDINSLVLGVTAGENGQHTVKANMSKLVHIGVGGSSGFGKSVFLRAMGYQLALSQTPVDLAMVDLEGATLAPFAKCSRLLYPVADTERDAVAIFQALLGELDKRRELYAAYPGVDSLRAYNARSDKSLTPVVCLVDEATALLGDKSVESALRTLALRARKYGLWLVLAGQDWKANSLDTAIRNQLSSRIQFRAMSKSQSRVLLEQGGAEELSVEGRALAILPGSPLFEMQAPFISSKTIMDDIKNGGPRGPIPEPKTNGTTDLIYQLQAEGLTPSAIAKIVYGYKNARTVEKVREILESDG